MQADLAAAYMGVSESKFRTRVRQGVYPMPYEDGSNRLWYIEDLDKALDRLKGEPSSSNRDPYAEALERHGCG
jgi:hypothetical protein